jgi:2-amino-4-hydroxy-6-hydroxymethyldihydropteridine diphosphokinase
MPVARIGIGSNVGDAAAHVRAAFDALDRVGSVLARSSFYRTKAWGVTEQPDFYNAAALVETALSPAHLLSELKALEGELGRVTTFRWGPRVIDLDILAYDDIVLDEPDLTIPHARLHEREGALAPLAEIDAGFVDAYLALSADERAHVVRDDGQSDVAGGRVTP